LAESRAGQKVAMRVAKSAESRALMLAAKTVATKVETMAAQ
jgi:hypothetical protein